MFGQDHSKTKQTKSAIELLQADFFLRQGIEQKCLGGNRVGPECRWVIFSRGIVNDDIITLKQKIQESILNKIVEATDNHGWTNEWGFLGNWGVKGYIQQDYLKEKLDKIDKMSNNNVELAQMLCFESMNLGIMKSEKKPYEVVESFTRENSELVKKISVEHPEFFVDGSIVEACVRAMSHDQAFESHIFKHVKYMGMEERRKQRNAM